MRAQLTKRSISAINKYKSLKRCITLLITVNIQRYDITDLNKCQLFLKWPHPAGRKLHTLPPSPHPHGDHCSHTVQLLGRLQGPSASIQASSAIEGTERASGLSAASSNSTFSSTVSRSARR